MAMKSLGKIAAIAAVAGLGLTACADSGAQQAREQEETCGLLMSANIKVGEAMGTIRASDGGDDRSAFSVQSAAQDLRNHSFNRSNDEPTPQGDNVELRTAVQVQAAYFSDVADALSEDVSQAQSVQFESIEVDGMGFEDASTAISSYCGDVFAQQQQQGGGF